MRNGLKEEVINKIKSIIARECPYSPAFATLCGSHAWGDNTADSDIDVFVLNVANLRDYCSLTKRFVDAKRLQYDNIDIEVWELSKWLSLMAKGNFNAFFRVIAPPIEIYNDILYKTCKITAVKLFSVDTIKSLMRFIEHLMNIGDERRATRYYSFIKLLENLKTRGDLMFIPLHAIKRVGGMDEIKLDKILIPDFLIKPEFVDIDFLNIRFRK